MIPLWVLRVAEVAARAGPPLLRALRAKRAAANAEARRDALVDEVNKRLRERRR